MIKFYLNTNFDYVLKVQFYERKIVRCVGKSIDVEYLEHNCVKIDNKYFELNQIGTNIAEMISLR